MKLDRGKVEFIDIPWQQEWPEFIKISLLEGFALSEFWRRIEVRFDPLLDFFASWQRLPVCIGTVCEYYVKESKKNVQSTNMTNSRGMQSALLCD